LTHDHDASPSCQQIHALNVLALSLYLVVVVVLLVLVVVVALCQIIRSCLTP
jgi:hypothetical protein